MTAAWEIVGHVRRRFGAVLGVSAAVTLVQALVAAPIAALLLRLFLAHGGKASIGNFEIARFFLAPIGIAALLVLGALALAGTYVQVAALLRVLHDPPVGAFAVLVGMRRDTVRILRLGALEVGAVLAVAVPLCLAMRLLVSAFWGDADLNALLVLKPPEFWWGVAAAALPAVLLAVLLGWATLRWLLALPVLLEERSLRPIAALRRSATLVRGRTLRNLRALAGWALIAVLLETALPALVAWPGALLLANVGTSLGAALPATALVLALWLAAVTAAGWFSLALLAAVLDRLHREAVGKPLHTEPTSTYVVPVSRVRLALWGTAGVAVLAVAGGWWLLRTQVLLEDVEITAHRMGGLRGPENTLAALRRAIADRAEWAELDVQLTSDGALVVLHDFDLVRIGGPAKRVADATLAEIRSIDVGRGLGAHGFDGERVPTLDEVITTAGDAIRLNIELKPPTPAADAPLTDAVLAAVRAAGLVTRCRLCSQSYEAMRRAKEAEPGLTVGFIAGAALGDLSHLKVDFLMVSARLATPRLVRQAHARGMQVHPWTINDPDDLAALLDRGADNVITDVPDAMRKRLDELRGLTAPERLLLRVRNLLAD